MNIPLFCRCGKDSFRIISYDYRGWLLRCENKECHHFLFVKPTAKPSCTCSWCGKGGRHEGHQGASPGGVDPFGM